MTSNICDGIECIESPDIFFCDSKGFMRITILMIWLCCLTPFISYACSDEERAEMLKAGISPEYIKKSCEIEGLESQPTEKKLMKSSNTLSQTTDLEKSKEQVAENELNFENSEMHHQIMLMLGTITGNLDADDGNFADLSGVILQYTYYHLFENEVIAGLRWVQIAMSGNMTKPIIYDNYSRYDYRTGYELIGFGVSLGRKFELGNSKTFPNLTYMNGDASLTMGPFEDFITGRGDYLAVEVPFLWNYEQVVFGIAPQFTISGGSVTDNLRIRTKNAFSLVGGITF